MPCVPLKPKKEVEGTSCVNRNDMRKRREVERGYEYVRNVKIFEILGRQTDEREVEGEGVER